MKNKTMVKLRKRIQSKENYYLEMPINSEVHIITPTGLIELSIEVRSDGSLRAFGMREEKQKTLFRSIGFHKLEKERPYNLKNEMRIILKARESLPIPAIDETMLFSLVKGTDQEKQEALRDLINNGEIYESQPHRYRWID